MAWEAQAKVPEGLVDEAGLVDGLRAGSGDAFKALHTAYAARIYNLALRIVDDPEDAQDVAQEVLLKVFRGLPGTETDLNLAAWLYRVTVNAAFDQVRARKRRPITVVDEQAPEIPTVVDEYERAELARRVESTLRELPKRQQLALVLRDVHGLSVGETASVLGLTKGSADVLLSRARAGFRRVFLAGAGTLRGRCDKADRALAAGVGRGEPVPPRLLEHSRTCPDCRRAVELWGAAPVGLGLLLPQVALPAKLSLGATLAAAQAAGIAVPAGLGAAGASAAGTGAGATAGAAGAAGATGATAAGAAAGAGGAGLLATLGSTASVKVATLAALATAAVGMTSVATHRADAPTGIPERIAGMQTQASGRERAASTGAQAARAASREQAAALRRAYRGDGEPGVAAGGVGRRQGSGERSDVRSSSSPVGTGDGGAGSSGMATGAGSSPDAAGGMYGSGAGGTQGRGDGSGTADARFGGTGGTGGSGGGTVSRE